MVTFQVQTGSKATVCVREQLASVAAPGDAILETTEVTGSFGLRPDGAFSGRSKITVGLDALRSNNDRDNFVKGQTLDTRRFPSADFVPFRTVGLPSPLPASPRVASVISIVDEIRLELELVAREGR